MQAEGSAKGLGAMYAAMGGGRDGIEACGAIEALCEVSMVAARSSSTHSGPCSQCLLGYTFMP